ncbi:hypothetical protein FHS31_000942 [Sphingomonas vulcanisoli]|uniref:Uncharacterized protein n=1 Tax=Sphingomonas vulcanisoli TaxID=1658060 RepID=A0ABX0TUS6_9SPHN|nr:hypothetical protein [Sphingomonas vulcanisoli]NIJ07346.1 hypothetical protein [Sphingomonas vulcanisoli]
MKQFAIVAAAIIAFSPALASRADRAAQQAAEVQAGEAQLAKLTKGLVPGKPFTCAPTERWTGSQNISGVGILYELGGQRYLNRMDPVCAHFDSFTVPVIVSHGMTCRGDIVRFVDSSSHFPRGSCSLGDFIPYEKPKG